MSRPTRGECMGEGVWGDTKKRHKRHIFATPVLSYVDINAAASCYKYFPSLSLKGSPPVVLSGLSAGTHTLLVDPQGCQENKRRARYRITVG